MQWGEQLNVHQPQQDTGQGKPVKSRCVFQAAPPGMSAGRQHRARALLTGLHNTFVQMHFTVVSSAIGQRQQL